MRTMLLLNLGQDPPLALRALQLDQQIQSNLKATVCSNFQAALREAAGNKTENRGLHYPFFLHHWPPLPLRWKVASANGGEDDGRVREEKI